MHIKLYEDWKLLNENTDKKNLSILMNFLDKVGYKYDKNALKSKEKTIHNEFLKVDTSLRPTLLKYIEKLERLNDFDFSINRNICLSGLSNINLPGHSYTFEEKPDHFEDLSRNRDLILYALRFLLYADISVEGATALVANLWAESYLNPLQYQFDGGPGRGIAQWTNTQRWATYINTFLPKFKAQNSINAKYNWYDLDPQLCFIMDELINGTYDSVYDELKTSGNLDKKTLLVLQSYEIAGTRNDKSQQLKRYQIADMIYNIAKSDSVIKYILVEVDLNNKINKILKT